MESFTGPSAPDAGVVDELFDDAIDDDAADLADDPAALTIERLTPRNCRWPAGETASGRTTFCGCATVIGRSFCKAHMEVAYAKLPATRKKEMLRELRRLAK